jgi:hypothetical protein
MAELSSERLFRSLERHGKTVRKLKIRDTIFLIVEDQVEIRIYFSNIGGTIFVEVKDLFSSFFDVDKATTYILNALDEISMEERRGERTD